MEGHRIPNKIEPTNKEWLNERCITKEPPEYIKMKRNNKRMLKEYELYEVCRQYSVGRPEQEFQINNHKVSKKVYLAIKTKIVESRYLKRDWSENLWASWKGSYNKSYLATYVQS